jgi:hypothetical protein
MGSVTIAVYIFVTGRNRFPPMGTALKVIVINVGAGVNNININILTTVGLVDVFVVGTEVQTLLVRDTGKTPRGRVFSYRILESIDLGVFLNVGNLRWGCQVSLKGLKASPKGSCATRTCGGRMGLGETSSQDGAKWNSRQDGYGSAPQQIRQKHRSNRGGLQRCYMCA